MQNPIIGKYEAEDIDLQVEKVLRGLGNPEPPLNLNDVRALLRLDKQYYSCSDHTAIGELVSKIRIAGRQILDRPSILLDAIRKAQIRALYIPDQKRILIDQDIPKLKHRWNECHEIGHSIIPWHSEFLFGDTEYSLKPACNEKLEAEANYASGQLLFMNKRFSVEASSYSPTISSIKTLKSTYGNTLTSTLWRFVEAAHNHIPLIGIISSHPKYPTPEFNPEEPCKYLIHSPIFRTRFSGVNVKDIFEEMIKYCSYVKGGLLGESEVILLDNNGDPHIFKFESFSNTYEVLTLGVYKKPYEILG
jgi:hypothetical protein